MVCVTTSKADTGTRGGGGGGRGGGGGGSVERDLGLRLRDSWTIHLPDYA